MNQGVNYHPSLPKCYKIWLNVTHTIKTYILIKTEYKRTFQVSEDPLYHLIYHFYARNFLTYKTSFHEVCRLHCSVFYGSGRIHYHSQTNSNDSPIHNKAPSPSMYPSNVNRFSRLLKREALQRSVTSTMVECTVFFNLCAGFNQKKLPIFKIDDVLCIVDEILSNQPV